MLHTALKAVLLRELGALRRSVDAYPDDASVWAQPPGVPNAAGTLVLHLTGNLQHYLGAVLGGTPYRRDRPAEFSRRDVSRADLLAEIDATSAAIGTTFAALGTVGHDRPSPAYPEPVGGRAVATDDYLIHIAAHLAYHLGQIDYHRRIVTGDARGVDAVRPQELPPFPDPE